jgi:diguanylate cyclase (GGDEF)-like protein
MPAEAFIEAAGMLVFGSLLLYADALLIPLVYELSAGRLRSLMAGMIVTMTVVLAFDTLVFVSVFFWNATNYLVLLRSALVGKVFFASCFCVLMALYLRLLEREPLPAANGPGVRDLFAMLTYRQKFELLSAAAARDALTGVFNRGHFDQALGHECLRAERAGLPLSVVLADVDYFKAFNDRYGHPEGDRCLKAVASALDGARRPFDMTARYGGEEFAVLLPSTGLAGAMTVAEALRGAVAALNLRHEEHPLGLVTVSMGVGAIAPGESVDCTELIDRADRALYRAKAAGRNRVEAS